MAGEKSRSQSYVSSADVLEDQRSGPRRKMYFGEMLPLFTEIKDTAKKSSASIRIRWSRPIARRGR